MSEARYQDQEQGKDVHSHTVFQQLLVLEVLGCAHFGDSKADRSCMPENRDKTKYSVFLIISHSYHNLNVTAIQQQQNTILKLESIDRCSRWDHVFTESIQLAQVGVAASPLRSGLSGEERRLRGTTRGVHAPSCSAFLVRPVTPGRCPQGLHRRR